MLDTERAFPIKQKPFSALSKKTQHLFLTMAVPIEWMTKCNEANGKNYLGAWKIKQMKLNAMKTWICRKGMTLLVPIHPLFLCFSVLISNLLASILQPYSLVYSEPCQTSKMEPFARIVMRKNSFYWKPIIFWWFQETRECKGNDFAQNHLILEVLSNLLVHTFWSKSDETSVSTPICLLL